MTSSRVPAGRRRGPRFGPLPWPATGSAGEGKAAIFRSPRDEKAYFSRPAEPVLTGGAPKLVHYGTADCFELTDDRLGRVVGWYDAVDTVLIASSSPRTPARRRRGRPGAVANDSDVTRRRFSGIMAHGH